MFEKIVTALEPFALTMVVIAGLILTNRIQIIDHGIIGYVTIVIGAALIIVHIGRQIKTTEKVDKKDK
jgi:hypothetical protein